MKKWLLGIGALSLSFSLAACGSDSASIDKTDSDKAKTTQQEEKDAKETKADTQSNDKSNNDKNEKAENASKKDSSDKKASDKKKKLVDVTLNRTVDGNTIKVNYKGEVKTVRYLLVDTPKTKNPNSCVQPYGEDASARNKQLVNKGKLQLEFDKGDRTDKYGRMLAYVYADGKSVQQTLLKEGLARVAYVYEPNTKYLDTYKKDEQAAKDKDLKIWSKNGYTTDKGFNGCATKPKKSVSVSKPAQKSVATHQSETHKSNSSSSASSSSSNSAQASPSAEGTEHFANCTELRKKYPHGVPSTHPAYTSKMDRDNDNFACEKN
ncbi:thermonuclease family protein [Bacillus amyloliquefaciens]|uniref:thermonuclease family protein n=1 Tax=Bacillus amyloliquefaciens TaxID=1390 RepID=UPI0015800E38|nr:thermonuclease family protein [Bacillus amyloliquefaciens]NUI22257.1 thermonuclease family protein [Bacillus amyloliquefaciens]NUI31245.1 thermonuclease family protein [Bacillus amyloliquefaciens]NUI35202.1 thermonuclease family protein [Bacillus amyloliquefaciens]NUI69050.1 thermonuclease family protein [Bacillus amyloliquefaciens]NUI72752.1 thermonuclease family protein [Bacillus amyloliquefaciens]